ncbi:cytochrome c biogenesis protein CcdA [Halobacteriovorax sp. CON-3]|uniref:cytochrome c biogenesis protein CcdA n=1 Tax=Halobacteriovorax sp. CON-3 TaxID=3157710 RepID=UPI0037131118
MYRILLALAITLFAYADKKDYSDLLKAQVTTIEKDSNKYLTINLRNKDGWHTYWQNPGDSGLATEVEFKQGGDKIVLDLVEWPTPHKFIEKGDIQTFGHKGDYTYFYYLGNSFDNAKNFEVHLKYLICHDICIPQEKIIKGDFDGGIFKSKDNQIQVANSEMEKRFNNLPTLRETPTYLNLQLTKYEGGLALVYNITGDNQKLSAGQNVLTPYTTNPISFKREALYKDTKGNHYGLYQLDWDGEYLEPEYPLPADGRFVEPLAFKFVFNDPVIGETYRVDFDINSFGTNEESFKTFYSRLTKVNNDKAVQDVKIVSNEEGSSSLPYFLLMAFIGGLILNIMPCVLPVISLKLFGLIKHSNESRSKILKHNLFYSLGVLATFAALALTVVGLKSSGEQIGWGFQLQSPMFVAIMVFVIFTMALNLFGLFEFKTPGGTKLGNVEVRNTFYGDFISGVLATILSTPCSAPFLGTALTFAFSESSTNIVMIFLAIGFGLSAPFILTGIFPALIRFLPRPGMWMDHVKKLLGLTLILTVVWLLDVYSALVGSPVAMMYINSALVFTFFLFYMRKHMTKKVITTLLIIVPVFYLGYSAITTPLNTGGNGNSLIEDKKREGLNWTKWTQEEMNKRIDQKKLTFIDFTARWCITCKVNEKLVINTDSFKDMVAENQVDLLLGDWTRKDEAIGKWLESQGMVGVPAYFVINENGELIKLGETITLGKVKKALGVN